MPPIPSAVGVGPAEEPCSPEGPGCQAGRWRPAPPARLEAQGVLWALPRREALDFLQAPSSPARQGYLPRRQSTSQDQAAHKERVSLIATQAHV